MGDGGPCPSRSPRETDSWGLGRASPEVREGRPSPGLAPFDTSPSPWKQELRKKCVLNAAQPILPCGWCRPQAA